MNKQTIKKAASTLENEYQNISEPSVEIKELHKSLLELITSAKNESLNTYLDESTVPGKRAFQEGHLRNFPEYEKKYVEFVTELRGGHTQEELELIEKIKSL